MRKYSIVEAVEVRCPYCGDKRLVSAEIYGVGEEFFRVTSCRSCRELFVVGVEVTLIVSRYKLSKIHEHLSMDPDLLDDYRDEVRGL